MTWRELGELIGKMSDKVKDTPVELSCNPTEIKSDEGVRYFGQLYEVENDGSNAYGFFDGERNTI